jgi:hypothetical protein
VVSGVLYVESGKWCALCSDHFNPKEHKLVPSKKNTALALELV